MSAASGGGAGPDGSAASGGGAGPGEIRTVLFYREFKRFAGHHLKVWDYFNHVRSSPRHAARVRFSADSSWEPANPWSAVPDLVVEPGQEVHADVLFFSGMDWRQLAPEQRPRAQVPVVNLIQHPMHAWPDNPRTEFLPHHAIRICVSPEVAEAIADTGRVNGPIRTIPAAIDLAAVTAGDPLERDLDVLVAGLKNPEMGRAVAQRLRAPGRSVELVDSLVPRGDFLRMLRRARVTVFLPWRIEGFYLPALEGMALGTVVVCPDVLANRSWCIPGVNCLRPDYTEDEIVAAAEEAIGALPGLDEMVSRAAETAREHDLAAERAAFLEILEDADRLWREPAAESHSGS